MAWVTARVNGNKSANPRDFNPAGLVLYRLEARELIKPKAAQLFLDLLDAGQLASWVPGVVDLDLIRAAKPDGHDG